MTLKKMTQSSVYFPVLRQQRQQQQQGSALCDLQRSLLWYSDKVAIHRDLTLVPEIMQSINHVTIFHCGYGYISD
jgi:hypothetical protein